MSRWQALWQLFLARVREFYREPEVIFWVYGFPVLLAIGLGIAFMSREPEPPTVDVQESPGTNDAQSLVERLKADGIAAELHDAAVCHERLRTGKTALSIFPSPPNYTFAYDPARPESQLARCRVENVLTRWKAGIESEPGERDQAKTWKSASGSWRTQEVLMQEPGNRYIDFLMPGLMGMNLMGGGLWGVGFVIVDMRVRKLLKRFLATPMRRSDFLLSILAARMIFMLPEMLLLVLVGRLGFGVPIEGSWLSLVFVILLGSLAFSGIGLLVACRADKTETVSGLMNLVMLPMWLLSGTFFSSKRFPDFTQPFVQALPLTQLNEALRAIMLEGASLLDVGWRLAILTAWAVVGFALALKWFRWQ